MAIQQQFINADAFWELMQQPQYADTILELVEGEIIEMPKPSGLHGVVTMRIGRFIDVFVAEHKFGYVTAAETGYVIARNPDGRDTVRGYDCSFIRKDRLPEGIPDRHIPIAPNLSVEVISPGNSAEDIHTNIRELLSAGTQLIWIVYPKTRTVTVHTAEGAVTVETTDILDGQHVLPGFTLAVNDIFPD